MTLLRKTRCLFLLITIGFSCFAYAQTDSNILLLQQKIGHLKQQPGYINDTAYANTLIDLGYIYSTSYPDSALLLLAGNAERCKAKGYVRGEIRTYIIMGDAFQIKGMYAQALTEFETSSRLATKNCYKDLLSLILNRIGTVQLNQGNYPEALSKFYESLQSSEAIGDNELAGATLNNIAIVQFYEGKFTEAEHTYQQRLKIAQNMHDTSSMSIAYVGIGEVNLQQKNPVKALYNITLAYNLAVQSQNPEMLLNTTLSLAEVYYALDSLQKASSLYNTALQLSKKADNGVYICNALLGLAKSYHKEGLLQEALKNGLEGLQKAEGMGQVQLMRDANEVVSSVYESLNDDRHALTYYKAYKILSDSMNSRESQRAVTIEKDKYQFSKKENEFERKTLQQRWLIFSAFVGLVLLAIILWMILRNRKRLVQTYHELQYKNTEIEAEKLKAEDALFKLQDAQAQLIQSEKMASLGELTAGIAHEIQNPLNFVNNFSEVSHELIDELRSERLKTNSERDELLEEELLNDIKQNLEKINHHGKRADAIVKGMLQHSRQSKGVREWTDINALCDEYLRLSYHGLRAKDKTFFADFTTHFDETIGNLNIVPQDLGRVLLNLFNNAFYAVRAKARTETAGEYKPLVSVSTEKINITGQDSFKRSAPGLASGVEIVVWDNGSGIPQNIIDKIFQPFFTTKPTGEGTGLGLSLAYDIITKEHNGTLQVKSTEGKETRFIICLPAH